MEVLPTSQSEQPVVHEHRIRTALFRIAIGAAGLVGIAIGSHTANASPSSEAPAAVATNITPAFTSELAIDPTKAVLHITSRVDMPPIIQSTEEYHDEAKVALLAKPVRPVPSGNRSVQPSRLLPEKSRDKPLPAPELGPATLDYNSIVLSQSVLDTEATETTLDRSNYCSGMLIRNEAGDVIGNMSAQHCMRDLQIIRGSDGKDYTVLYSPYVDTGDSMDSLTEAGTTKYLIMNTQNDRDMLVEVFAGADPAEVLARVQNTYIGFDGADNVGYLDQVVLSGWPSYQPNNPNYFTRQVFKGFVLGKQVISTAYNDQTPVDSNMTTIWAGIQDSDGAKCSFGNSGGVGSVMVPQADGSTKLMSLGVLSAFIDFEGTTYGTPDEGQQAIDSYQNLFTYEGHPIDFRKSGITALCGFSVQAPELNSTKIVQVVRSASEIPGYNPMIIEQQQQSPAEVTAPPIGMAMASSVIFTRPHSVAKS